MSKALITAALAVCLMAGSVAHAADFKIGVVNMQVIAMQSEPAQEAQKKMKSTFGPEKDQLEKTAKDLQKKAEDMKAQSAALSPEAKEDKKVEFIRLKRDLDDKTRAFARKVEAAEMRIRQDMAQIILKAAKEYGEKKGFAMIIDGASGGVIHAEKSLDVTNDVLAEVNRLWRAGAKQ